jgi:DNA-binding transcriptional LysR family regulator
VRHRLIPALGAFTARYRVIALDPVISNQCADTFAAGADVAMRTGALDD